MKKIIPLLVMMLAVSGQSQDFVEGELITFGNVKMCAPADNAAFLVRVEGTGATLNEAVTAVRQQVEEITTALFDLGLSQKDISTSHFYSGENTGLKPFFSSREDFKASISVTVNITDLDLLEPAIIRICDFTPAGLSDISYTLNDYECLKMEALTAAIQKAETKAQLLARELGVGTGDVLLIEEIPAWPHTEQLLSSSRPGGYANPYNAAIFQAASGNIELDGGTAFHTREICFSVKVKLALAID